MPATRGGVHTEEATIAARDTMADKDWSTPRTSPGSPSASPAVAVELAADLVDLTVLRAARRRLLRGLVHDLGFDAAAAWAPLARDGGLRLRDQVGLPEEVADTFGGWPVDSVPDRLIRDGVSNGGQIAGSHASSGWDGRTLYVVAIPQPAREVIGAFGRDDAPDECMRLLVALGRTYASAVARSYAQRDAQHIIDALVEELRPTTVDLPPGFSVGHLYRSATTGVAIGGDLYDWFRTDRDDLGLAIGDVSGKGVLAASRTAMAVHSLRAFALPGASPRVAATMLNKVMCGRLSADSFLTLAYLRVDTRTADIDFVLAGHPPPVLMRHDRVEVVRADADLPVGVDPSTTFTMAHAVLQPGETLVLYTDGVTEARAPDGELLGLPGLLALLDDLRGVPAQQVADRVWRGVQEHTGGDTSDDVAVVALRRDPLRPDTIRPTATRTGAGRTVRR